MEHVPPVGGAGIVCGMCFGARNDFGGGSGNHGAQASPCGARRGSGRIGSRTRSAMHFEGGFGEVHDPVLGQSIPRVELGLEPAIEPQARVGDLDDEGRRARVGRRVSAPSYSKAAFTQPGCMNAALL